LWIEGMDITPETTEQTHHRLMQVMAHARMERLSGEYTFVEFPANAFSVQHADRALALVRDASSWSALIPAMDQTAPEERYLMLSFHFAADIPNSGFVGWLATQFKQRLGTGVFVVCGQNSRDGGIYDYWGIPVAVAAQALALVQSFGARLKEAQ
jgi:hypothetical protein